MATLRRMVTSKLTGKARATIQPAMPAIGARLSRLAFWPRPALLIGFAALTAARLPAVWPYGRLWAEEGRDYLANAWSAPWYAALFLVHGGYLNLPASATMTLAANLVSLERVSLVASLAALLIQLCPPVLLVVSAIRWLADWRVLALALLLIVLPPLAEEVWLNTITSQFHLMLALAIILAAPPGRGAVRAFQGPVLVLAPLCGPGAAMLLPLYFLRAWLDRSRPRLFQALLLLPGVLVQVTTVLTHHMPTRTMAAHLPVVLSSITAKHILLPLLGIGLSQRLTGGWYDLFSAGHGPLWPVIAPVVVFGALAVAAWRSHDAATRWLFAAAMTLMAASYLAALTSDGPFAFLILGFGNRYYFAPAALIGLVVLGLALNGPRNLRTLAGVMVAWLLLVGALAYPRAGQPFAHGPRWPDEVALWRADPAHPLAIWPTGWAVTLPSPARSAQVP